MTMIHKSRTFSADAHLVVYKDEKHPIRLRNNPGPDGEVYFSIEYKPGPAKIRNKPNAMTFANIIGYLVVEYSKFPDKKDRYPLLRCKRSPEEHQVIALETIAPGWHAVILDVDEHGNYVEFIISTPNMDRREIL